MSDTSSVLRNRFDGQHTKGGDHGGQNPSGVTEDVLVAAESLTTDIPDLNHQPSSSLMTANRHSINWEKTLSSGTVFPDVPNTFEENVARAKARSKVRKPRRSCLFRIIPLWVIAWLSNLKWPTWSREKAARKNELLRKQKEEEELRKKEKIRKEEDKMNRFLIRVQEIIEEEGSEVLNRTDEKGHTPVHWAALGGHTNIMRLMVEQKANLDIQSKNDLGPRPIHWGCVNGHVAIVDILLQAGVNIDTIDNKGCSPLIIACQYGQTTLACYLMAKGARLQLTDREGDNALHWAAFKGHCELTRLLIYSGFNPRQIDNYGQTPLHLACISGDLNTVKMLCEQDGVDINLPDHNQKTPLMLAQGRNHKDLITYLEEESKNQASYIPRINFKSIIFGPAGKSKGPFLFYIFNVLFWGYPMYIFKCVPSTFALFPSIHYVFLVINVVMWYALYKAYTTNPGFLPKNSSDYDQAIKRVAHFDEWKQGQNPLKRLCHTCRLVKPMRAKHCRICNRCVAHFDHHCPYIYNCVGFKNRSYFVGFTSCVSLLSLFTFYFAYTIITLEGWNILYVIGIVECSFFGLITSGLCFATWYMAITNTNTNERINFKKYDYLKDANGHYHNPFDRGIRYNCQEYFHFRKPMVDEEVENIYAYTV